MHDHVVNVVKPILGFFPFLFFERNSTLFGFGFFK